MAKTQSDMGLRANAGRIQPFFLRRGSVLISGRSVLGYGVCTYAYRRGMSVKDDWVEVTFSGRLPYHGITLRISG